MKHIPGRSKRLWIFGGLFLALLVIGLLAFWWIKQAWSAPLGPALALPTYTALAATPTDNPTIPSRATPNEPTAASSKPQPTPASSPTATPEPLCGGPASMYILGVGVDSESGDYLYGLGDIIHVARIDFVTPKITVLSIPRDLWVEIPEISDHYNITHGKLNQAFLFGGPGMGYYDGPGGGAGLLARTLDLNFGLRVEHYGVGDMQAFVKIVDSVGGIDIYLTDNVDGRPLIEGDDDFGFYYAGQHHFSGAQALRFARIRERYNDFVRIENQNLVIQALADKLLSPAMLPKVPQIVETLLDNALTDFSPEQISQLICLIPKVSRENIVMTGFPVEIFKSDRIYSPIQKDIVYILDVENSVIRGYVQQFNAGTWP